MPHHRYESENLKRLLLHHEPKLYEEITKVFDIFQGTDGHLSIEELQQELRSRGIEIDLERLSSHMAKIVDLGFASKKDFQDQPARYEHRHLGYHHDHLICIRCGKIVEFEDRDLEELQESVARRHGFTTLHHRMELYGICKDCKGNLEKVMPLPLARPGERLVVRDVLGGRLARLRLFSMGLRPGDEVEVISDSMGDGLIIARGETRIAIGKGISQKIMVSLVDHRDDSVISSNDKGP